MRAGVESEQGKADRSLEHALVTKQRRPHATNHNINRDPKRDQETRSNGIHASQTGHCCRPTKDEHG